MWAGHTAMALTAILAGDNSDVIDRKISNRPLHGQAITVASDASVDKVASFQVDGKMQFVQLLDKPMQAWSSSRRELKAVLQTLRSKKAELRQPVLTT